MSDPFQYVTLVASLPHLRPIFTQAHLPLSPYRLGERLKMLEEEHRAILDRVVSVVGWSSVAAGDADADVIARFEAAMADLEAYPTLVALLRRRLETRQLVAALRFRREGADESVAASFGTGRVARAIRANWGDPGFGLAREHSWLREAQGPVARNDHIALERIVLTEVFRQIERVGADHHFDFEAVVLYALRFQVMERWRRYDTDRARTRLSHLLESTLETASGSLSGLTPRSRESLS